MNNTEQLEAIQALARVARGLAKALQDVTGVVDWQGEQIASLSKFQTELVTAIQGELGIAVPQKPIEPAIPDTIRREVEALEKLLQLDPDSKREHE
jgi:hypothetical protein